MDPTLPSTKMADLGLPLAHIHWRAKLKSLFFDVPAGFAGQGCLWFTNTAPNGWLICDGSSLNIADFPQLYAVLGTTYGGDGVTTFSLPDLRQRVPAGRKSGDSDFGTLAHTGGEKTHVLTLAELASHSHPQNVTANSGGSGIRRDYVGDLSGAHSYAQGINTDSVGSDTAHNNLQPFLVINFIVKV